MDSIPQVVNNIPDALLRDVAIGTETLADICDRLGFSPEETKALAVDPVFKRKVDRAKVALRSNKVLHRERAKFAVEKGQERLLRDMLHPETTPKDALDIYKELRKDAGLDAPAQGAGGVPTFVFNFQTSDPNTSVRAAFIDTKDDSLDTLPYRSDSLVTVPGLFANV